LGISWFEAAGRCVRHPILSTRNGARRRQTVFIPPLTDRKRRKFG
jgi:hypothetical protein